MFGIFKKKQPVHNELSTSKKITINLKKLLENLGSKENINGIEYTHTKITFFINDAKIINTDSINKMKSVKGIFLKSNKITLIVDKQAKLIAESLKI